MEERRAHKRKYVLFYSRIRDRHTGDLIGHLVDLTPEGALVISESCVEIGAVYNLQLELPEELFAQQFFKFDALSLWCRPDVNPRFQDIGFQLLNVTPEERAVIEQFVSAYGFREH